MRGARSEHALGADVLGAVKVNMWLLCAKDQVQRGCTFAYGRCQGVNKHHKNKIKKGKVTACPITQNKLARSRSTHIAILSAELSFNFPFYLLDLSQSRKYRMVLNKKTYLFYAIEIFFFCK